MVFVPTPQGIKVAMNAVQNGVPIVNVYHVRGTAPITLEQLEDVGQVFVDWWEELRMGVHQSVVMQDITVTDISVANGQQHQETTFANPAGNVSTAATAANAAAVISWRTPNTGRSFRGRTFVGGIPNAALTNAQEMTTTQAAFYAVTAFSLIDALQTAGKALAVLSKYSAGVLRVAGLLTDIVNVIVDVKVDSQRRRTAN